MRLNEKGIVLPLLVILILGSSILTLSLLGFTGNQLQSSAFNENKIKARYVAEVGAKLGICAVYAYLQANPSTSYQNCSATATTGNVDNTTNSLNYTYSYEPVWFATNTTTIPDYILVTGAATVAKVTATAKVRVNISTEAVSVATQSTNFTADALDLIKSANLNPTKNCYSSTNGKIAWTVNETGHYGSHVGTAKDRIIFDNTLAKDFAINYCFEFTKNTGLGVSGGPGVIYGVDSTDSSMTAENFNGYWAKFNYQRESFAVTKSLVSSYGCAETSFTYGTAMTVESNGTLTSVSNYCNDYQGSATDDARAFQPNGSGVSDSSSATTFNITSDATKTDPLGNAVGRSSIPLDNLKTVMTDYYTNLLRVKSYIDNGTTYEDLTATDQAYYDQYTVYFADREIPTSFNYDVTDTSISLLISIQTETFEGSVIHGNVAVGDTSTESGTTYWQATSSSTETLTRQHVLIDGKEILNFVDYSTYYTPYASYNTKTKKFADPINYSSSSTSPTQRCYNASVAKISLYSGNNRSGLSVSYIDPAKMKFYNYTSISKGETVSNATSAGDLLWVK